LASVAAVVLLIGSLVASSVGRTDPGVGTPEGGAIGIDPGVGMPGTGGTAPGMGMPPGTGTIPGIGPPSPPPGGFGATFSPGVGGRARLRRESITQ